jgi:hypothetical protein
LEEYTPWRIIPPGKSDAEVSEEEEEEEHFLMVDFRFNHFSQKPSVPKETSSVSRRKRHISRLHQDHIFVKFKSS